MLVVIIVSFEQAVPISQCQALEIAHSCAITRDSQDSLMPTTTTVLFDDSIMGREIDKAFRGSVSGHRAVVGSGLCKERLSSDRWR